MIRSMFHVRRVVLSNAPRLYPKGIDWVVRPGCNVIAGGTSLGKTTLVNAILFGLFGDLGRSSKRAPEKISASYFKGRLVAAKTKKAKKARKAKSAKPRSQFARPPIVTVEAAIGERSLRVTRNLDSGRIEEALLDDRKLKRDDYESVLTELTNAPSYDPGVVQMVDYLLYASETRFMLAWDSQVQNEIVSLLLARSETFRSVHDAWDALQSADSSFRNIRAQAARVERDLEELKRKTQRSASDSAARKRLLLERKLEGATDRCKRLEESRRAELRERDKLSRQLHACRTRYSELTAQLEEVEDLDPDDTILQYTFANPSSESVYAALKALVDSRRPWTCPCCGKTVGPRRQHQHLQDTIHLLQRNACPVCASSIATPRRKDSRPQQAAKTEQVKAKLSEAASPLRELIYREEQLRSRLRKLEGDLADARRSYEAAQNGLWSFNLEFPPEAGNALDAQRIALHGLQKDQRRAQTKRNSLQRRFNVVRDKSTRVVARVRRDVSRAFVEYAGMFLDETCDVVVDTTGALARRQGRYLIPTHAAFYPVIDGVTRTTPQTLSEAQALFVDLAFRMALLDVWSSRAGEKATLFLETPEGSVDIAYMVRVAEMLRRFASKGHTLVLTTNLNNRDFLPELLRSEPSDSREERILNMLDVGVPRPVQIEHKAKFKSILRTMRQIGRHR